jgi:signal transduction histidine kinase
MATVRELLKTSSDAHVFTTSFNDVMKSLSLHSKSLLTALSFVLVLLFSALDYISGPVISSSIFYLLPICLVTWSVGRPWGIAIALASAAVWLVADLMWPGAYLHTAIPYWNAIMRFGLFLIVVLLLSQLKSAYKLLHDTVAERTASLTTELAERKRAEQQLEVSRTQLRQLSAHLQLAREEERTRIAREIHDELGQTLTALKMDVTSLGNKMPKDKEMLREKTRSMVGLIDSGIQEVRRISTELRPALLDHLGLVAALECEAKDFENRWGINCTFSSHLEDVKLDDDRATAIFRIFQETLTNVARHAYATHVKAGLCQENGHLTLEVRDNGKGITEKELSDPKSLGLLGMRERALVLGGSVKIGGCPRNGTTVTLVVPSDQTMSG